MGWWVKAEAHAFISTTITTQITIPTLISYETGYCGFCSGGSDSGDGGGGVFGSKFFRKLLS